MKDHPIRRADDSGRGVHVSRRALLGGIFAGAATAPAMRASAVHSIQWRGAVFPSDEIVPRYQHTATLMGDGSVFVAGGISHGSGVLSDARLYNSALGIWYSAAPMETPRYHHAAVALSPTLVLVMGGLGANHQPLNDAEIYDYSVDSWISAPPLQIPRHQHTATMLADGSVFVAGGIFEGILTDFEIYRV